MPVSLSLKPPPKNCQVKIKDGTYGYCEETGKEIGIKRLEARPIATLSIEARERYEQMKRITQAGH